MFRMLLMLLALIIFISASDQTDGRNHVTIVYIRHKYFLADAIKGNLLGPRIGEIDRKTLTQARCDTDCAPPLIKGGEQLYTIRDSKDIAALVHGTYYRFAYYNFTARVVRSEAI
ncbi:hypothetical protein [Paenibacillus lutrae]|uniref:Uncharacterized protein n=1 Tax=Paenibacillus lutrae TaxID=2078573 RepID=A0A7X3K0U1_9BACL|nr:hypothetical protein [Paenibacillus lutrae]MVP01435.1 hypothetical protein [Paenibacillus lutrae]